MTATYVAVLFALFAYKSNLSSLLGLQSRSAYLFTAMMLALLIPYISISLYTNDKRIYLADASAKLYSPSAYYVAKVGKCSSGLATMPSVCSCLPHQSRCLHTLSTAYTVHSELCTSLVRLLVSPCLLNRAAT